MPSIIDDETCVRRYFGLLEDLAVYGDSQLPAKMAKTKILGDLDMAEEVYSETDSILLDSIHSIRLAFTDKAEPLTLREVYGTLMSKQNNEDSMNIQQVSHSSFTLEVDNLTIPGSRCETHVSICLP